MKKIFLLPALAAVICLSQACSSTSQTTNADTITTSNKTVTTPGTSNDDVNFANQAAVGGIAEVTLGNMALSKSSSAGIKDFANMMITDHTKANNELVAIAGSKHIALPASLDAEHKAKSDSLSKLSGADFDKAYVATMVEDHKKTLNLMQKEASKSKDEDFKAFATKTIPVIQAHLGHVLQLQADQK